MANYLDKYYTVLGLTPEATLDEVKKAYRRLAKKYHPDRNKAAGARKRFEEIAEAYQMILNPPKRNRNEEHSEEILQKIWEEAIRKAREEARRKARMRYIKFLKEQEKKQSRAYAQALVVLVSIIALVFLVNYGLEYYKNHRINTDLGITYGQVVRVQNHQMLIQYRINGKLYEQSKWVSRATLTYVTPNGMPVLIGHVFQVEYDNSDPDYFRINFNRVSEATLESYLELAQMRLYDVFETEMAGFPDYTQRKIVNCLSHRILKDHGIDGLAHVYFFDEHPLENFSHNSFNWKRFKRRAEMDTLTFVCGITQN